jgi:ribosomal protein S18 acetylase RimI-like enzyme
LRADPSGESGAPTIRRLAPADAPVYRALMLEAYERHPDAFTSSVAERAALPETWWQARLSAATDALEMVLGAFVRDDLVGCAGLSFESREKTRHKSTLFGMYVDDGCRHLGIGRALVMAVLAAARRRGGVRLVQLTVTDGNAAARRLYERCGFAAFGVEPCAMALGDAFVAKVHMWRALDA